MSHPYRESARYVQLLDHKRRSYTRDETLGRLCVLLIAAVLFGLSLAMLAELAMVEACC